MAVRYGIDLTLQPSFTAKVHLTRRIVADQYSSWTAARQILRVPLTPYFPCPDEQLPILAEQVQEIAQETREQKSYMLRRSAMVASRFPNAVVMAFEAPEPLFDLQRKALATAQHHFPPIYLNKPFLPCISLLEFARLPESLLLDAAEFAEGVASGLDMPGMALPWRLLLTRYSSRAAGDDWSDGRWAADLSCRQLYSHPVYAEVSSVFEMLSMVRERQSKEDGGRKGIWRFFGMD